MCELKQLHKHNCHDHYGMYLSSVPYIRKYAIRLNVEQARVKAGQRVKSSWHKNRDFPYF